MTDDAGPSYDDIRTAILAVHDEDWLKDKLRDHHKVYGDRIQDDRLKLWMIAKSNRIQVSDIKVPGGYGDNPDLQLADFTNEFAKRELAKDQDDQRLFAVEGVVLGLRTDLETSKGNPKAKFTLVDPSGSAVVTAYAETAVGHVVNARLHDGDYIRIPSVGVYGGDADFGFWKTLTVPAFQDLSIESVDKDPRAAFKDITQHAAMDGDWVRVEGIVTNLDDRHRTACASCGCTVKDEGTEHKPFCDDPDATVEQTGYSGTISTGTSQLFKFQIAPWSDKTPDFEVGLDVVTLVGTWGNKYRTVQVEHWFTDVDASSDEDSSQGTPEKSPDPDPEDISEETNDAPATEEIETTDVSTDASLPEPSNYDELAELADADIKALAKASDTVDARQSVEDCLTGLAQEYGFIPDPEPDADDSEPADAEESEGPTDTGDDAPVDDAASQGVPDDVRTHLTTFVKNFGGRNRTTVVLNTMISRGVAVDEDAALKQLEAAVADGVVSWNEEDSEAWPPTHVTWVEED